MKNSFDKTFLLTGSSGFLGAYISAYLKKSGYEVFGIGRKNAEIIADLRVEIPDVLSEIDYVVHAAGKAHIVPKNEDERHDFYRVNHIGTLNLIEALKKNGSNVKSFIFISTVAVYGLNEGELIDEYSPLLATAPYGQSKILAEQEIISFCNANNINYCILRLPLIAGKNPPGNLGSMIKAINQGWYFSIGNANARKSIVLAEDIASFIPNLLDKKGIYNLTDGYHPSFGELENAIAENLHKRNPLKIPQAVAALLAKAGDIAGNKSPFNTSKLKKIQSTLTFSDQKAKKELNWEPHSVIDYYSNHKT